MKKPLTRFLAFLFILALVPAQDALADWKVYYTGKAGQMFGYGGRGSFASKSQCESARTSRPGFERNNSHCSGFDRYVAPAPRPPSGGRSNSPAPAAQVQQPDPAALAAQRLQEEVAAKQRAQVAAMEQAAAAMQQQQFDQGKGSLASDLRNRLNASAATSGQALSDCWAARAGQAAQRGDRAGAKSYADYSIAAREGKSVPACHAGQSPAIPMPQGVAIVDDDKVRRMEEQMRLDPRIATLYGKREEARATAEKKRAAVETLEKISRNTTDPKAKQETDALLAEAKKTLADALDEDQRATEEINRAEKEWKTLNDAKARAEQTRPGASAGSSAAR